LKQGAAVRCVRDEKREPAPRYIETYAVGDARGFLACLTDDWQLHDAAHSSWCRRSGFCFGSSKRALRRPML